MQARVLRDARLPVRVLEPELLVAAPQHHHVARLHLHAGAPLRLVQLARGHRAAHRDVALIAPGRHVEEHATGGDAAVEDRVDRAPQRALDGEALRERAPVVQLAVPAHVAERVHVGDPVAVVDHVEAVEHHVHPLALRRKRHVVHVHRPRDHVARQRDGAALLDQPLGLRLLGRRDQVHGAELVVVPPAAPVVQLLEVAFDATLPSNSQFATRKTASKAPASRSAPGSRRASSPGSS